MVQFGVGFIRQNPAPHGAVFAGAAGYRGVDWRVDRAHRVRGAERAKAEVVIPRDHGKLAVFFVKVIVVDHHAGIAVVVAHIIVYTI